MHEGGGYAWATCPHVPAALTSGWSCSSPCDGSGVGSRAGAPAARAAFTPALTARARFTPCRARRFAVAHRPAGAELIVDIPHAVHGVRDVLGFALGPTAVDVAGERHLTIPHLDLHVGCVEYRI